MAAASMIKLECPICFNEANSFKILQCGHHFCAPCVDQLRTANSDSESSVKTKDMECPQCRQVTPANAGLKTKFMSNLMCRQCDEEKLVDEFRWCHQCTVSVCSKCFVDKHMSTNDEGAISLHRASKWDVDYPAVKYCIGQLKRDASGVADHVKKTQDYLVSYLEGFQEYLCREIDQRIRSSNGQLYDAKIAALSRTYDVDANGVEPAAEIDKNYDRLLTDLFKVAKLDVGQAVPTSPEASFTESQLKLKCLPYKTMADILLGVQPVAVTQNGVNETTTTTTSAIDQFDPALSSSAMETSTIAGNDDPPPYATMDVDSVSLTSEPIYPPPPPIVSSNNNNNNNSVATANATGFVLNDELFNAAKGGRNLLDVDLISRKFASTTVVRPDVIKQPSDICYLSSIDTLLITDFINGIFTLKNNRALNGPVHWKQRYQRYSRITVVPARLIQSAAMVNLQFGAVWYYAVVIVNGEGRAEPVQLHNKSAYHSSFPTSTKHLRQPTTASSDRSLFCLTSKSLYRFAWPEQQNDWQEVYTVSAGVNPHQSAVHQQGRLGPIIDRNDRTEVYLINPIWQSIDIVTLRYPENTVMNVSRVELRSLFPSTMPTAAFGNQFVDPFFAKLTDDTFLLADKKRSVSYIWNRKENTLMQWHNFSTKTPQKIIYHDGVFFVITQNQVNTNVRALEIAVL